MAAQSIDFQRRSDLEPRGADARGNGVRDEQRLGQVLGWFSIALGVTELLAPRAVGRAIGIEGRTGMLRLLGMREIASGLGLLMQHRSAPWAWSRVAGDAMDLALLGAASRSSNSDPRRIALAAATVLGVTALDVYSSRRLSRAPTALPECIEVRHALAINTNRQSLYDYWCNLENLPSFMRHLQSVQATNQSTSHWVARAPGGTTVEWDAEITDNIPGERLSWRTLPGSEVVHTGTVTFSDAPSGRGTIVCVELRYQPPAGQVGQRIAQLLGEEPKIQIRDDLSRLKQLLETGEIATTDGQPHGKRSLFGRATLSNGTTGRGMS